MSRPESWLIKHTQAQASNNLKTIKNPTVTPRLGHGIQFLNLKSEINFASESRRPPFRQLWMLLKSYENLKIVIAEYFARWRNRDSIDETY